MKRIVETLQGGFGMAAALVLCVIAGVLIYWDGEAATALHEMGQDCPEVSSDQHAAESPGVARRLSCWLRSLMSRAS